MDKWQPIETAPKDMTYIVLYGHLHGTDTQCIAAWDSDKKTWILDKSGKIHYPNPTHWMPLPKPPEVTHEI